MKPGITLHATESDPSHLLAALVDLGQECLKDLLLQALGLVHGGDLGPQLSNGLLLVVLVDLVELQLVKDGLDLGLKLAVLASVGFVQHLALLGRAPLQGLVDQPRALVVLDIGADLANDGRVAVGVEVVVLYLEVLAQRDEDVVRLAQVVGGRKLKVVQRQRDGQVEAVVGRLVGHDEHVLVHGEVVQVDVVLGRGDQVAQLAQLRLPGDLVEQLHEVNVGRVRAELLLQDVVDRGLEHEGVVDRNHAHSLLPVPAGLTTARDRAVHDVVRDQEEGLQELRQPAQGGKVFELLLVQGPLEERKAGVRDGEAAVELAAGGVGVEGLKRETWSACSGLKVKRTDSRITFSNHWRALSGMPYCVAAALRSSTSEGKTASKSARLVVAIVKGAGGQG